MVWPNNKNMHYLWWQCSRYLPSTDLEYVTVNPQTKSADLDCEYATIHSHHRHLLLLLLSLKADICFTILPVPIFIVFSMWPIPWTYPVWTLFYYWAFRPRDRQFEINTYLLTYWEFICWMQTHCHIMLCLRPGQPTLAASPPVGCYCPHQPSSFFVVIITEWPVLWQIGSWFRDAFNELSKAPRYLIPCYFDALVTGVYNIAEEVFWNKMSPYVIPLLISLCCVSMLIAQMLSCGTTGNWLLPRFT